MANPVIVVEDGTIVPAANCYVSLAWAKDFLAGNLYTEAWDAADDVTKSKALIMSCRILDAEIVWKGVRMNPAPITFDPTYGAPGQPLQWPRNPWPRKTTAVFIKTPQEDRAWFQTNEVPQLVKEANAELAVFLLGRNLVGEFGTEGFSSISVGKGDVALTLNPEDRPSPIPPYIAAKVSRYSLQVGGQKSGNCFLSRTG